MLFYRKYEHNTSYIDRFVIRNHIKNPPLSDFYDLRVVREEPEAPFAQTAASPILPKRRRTTSAATFQSRSLRKTSPPISIRAVRTCPKNSKKKRESRFPTLSKKKNFKKAATCWRTRKTACRHRLLSRLLLPKPLYPRLQKVSLPHSAGIPPQTRLRLTEGVCVRNFHKAARSASGRENNDAAISRRKRKQRS